MTETVHVDLAERGYDILVGDGELTRAAPHLARVLGKRAPVIVTDTNVAPLHLGTLRRTLAEAGHAEPAVIILPAGEGTKDFAHLAELADGVLAAGIERSSALVALGGGVIGDITGFAASILLRGIDFVQVPTTLLALVDSSVGGKTGINTARGKNLVGTFHQPRLVIADTATLDTLPRREVLAGYAEVAKYGLIRLPDFFAWCETNGSRIVDGDSEARREAVAVSCRAKADIVGRDEKEHGDRALLNLGHTFGHALEASMGYDGRLLHGEAVAIGTVMAFDASASLGFCPVADARRVRAHFRAVGLPVTPLDVAGAAWDVDELLHHMTRDKKVKDGRVTFILTRGIGAAFVEHNVETDVVRSVLEASLRV
jgi:3-dehydroquinate synthase